MVISYEFARGELKKEFNQTKIGKRINYVFYSALSFTVAMITGSIFSWMIVRGYSGLELISRIVVLNALPVMVTAYLEGRKHGAFAQFKAQSIEKSKK